ncbi:hypothetical protein [Planococcus salinarum]|uniref:hypothetical protein n=1 Tax=Planococcus salinarum TaxID=622695 RepID=UPI000E3E059C|nr:hypothetical protein [Planococcus salinarum]TAA72607.1 hypothetical protein D2909_05410 [Planococcus salinarum]
MKGFLSFLGITLITIAFGAILFSFYGNPLEDFKKQERQQVFQEMRANPSAPADSHMTSTSTAKNGDDRYSIQSGQSCLRLSFDH